MEEDHLLWLLLHMDFDWFDDDGDYADDAWVRFELLTLVLHVYIEGGLVMAVVVVHAFDDAVVGDDVMKLA